MKEERTMFAVSKSLRAIAGALALSAICASALAAEKVVAITSFVEHPALDARRIRSRTTDRVGHGSPTRAGPRVRRRRAR